MLEGEGIINGVANKPTRKLVAEWVVSVYSSVQPKTVRNTWTKKRYKWF